MSQADLGQLSLLEWSQDLNRALLQLPFRPLRSTIHDQACFLYKLAFSSSRKQLGLLLLDCDACSAFYEGLPLRTLDRRTQLDQTEGETNTASQIDNDAQRLAQIMAAIHHAVDPRTALDSSLKTIVGLESTRFSSSLSISVKSKHDAVHLNFKTSFDLDPLDHASSANLISTHVVRPLLHLARVFAQSASQQLLDSISQHRSSTTQHATSSDSLELLRRSAIVIARLPIEQLHPLSARRHEDNALAPVVTTTPAPLTTTVLGDDDDDDYDSSDMVFFGPPGLGAPLFRPMKRRSPLSRTVQQRSASPTSSAGSEDADRTLTAPLASTKRTSSANLAFASPPKSSTHAAHKQDHSDTSDEESLPIAGISSKNDALVKQPSSPQPAGPKRAAKRDSPSASPAFEKIPELTPPPPSLVPTSSQISPSSSNALRDEQQRRRQQIATIKRGNALTAQTDNAARPAASTRKRARF